MPLLGQGMWVHHMLVWKVMVGVMVMVKVDRELWHSSGVYVLVREVAVSTGFRGGFGPKKAVLGHKMRRFGRAPPDLAPPPRGATGEFLAQNLDLARAPPRL